MTEQVSACYFFFFFATLTFFGGKKTKAYINEKKKNILDRTTCTTTIDVWVLGRSSSRKHLAVDMVHLDRPKGEANRFWVFFFPDRRTSRDGECARGFFFFLQTTRCLSQRARKTMLQRPHT
jgi:hypothetical protein